MSTTITYKEYEGTAELDMERGVCQGKILFIADLVTYESKTIAGLQSEFEAAVDDYLATCEEIGKAPVKPFKGSFNVRVSPAMHRDAAIRGVRDGVGLNGVVARAIECYLYSHTDINHFVKFQFEGTPTTHSVVAGSTSVEWRTAAALGSGADAYH